MVSEVEVPRGDTTTPAELATALDGEVGRGQLIVYAGQLADPMDRCRKKRFPNLVSGKGLALEEDDFVTGTSHERPGGGTTGAAADNEKVAFVRRQSHRNL
jgi:hypothetical protein